MQTYTYIHYIYLYVYIYLYAFVGLLSRRTHLVPNWFFFIVSRPLMSIIHWSRIIGTKVLLLFLVQIPRLSRRHGARPALPVGVHAPPARA